jgi:hypothetical protein
MRPKIVMSQKMSSGIDQLHRGLEACGVQLVGKGYKYDERDVLAICDNLRPDIFLLQEKTVWDKEEYGQFKNAYKLKDHDTFKHILRGTFYTDLGSLCDYHREYHTHFDPDFIVTRYPTRSVRELNPWIDLSKVERMYWTIDQKDCPRWPRSANRRCACISGASNSVTYPLRHRLMQIRSAAYQAPWLQAQGAGR